MSQNRLQEIFTPIGLGVGKKIIRGSHLDDLAFIHKYHPAGYLPGEPHLMRHRHHGHALFGQIAHDVKNFIDHFRIQCRCGLIKEHDFGLHGQASCDGHALLLTARELGRIVIDPLFQTHPGEHLATEFFRLRFIDVPDFDGCDGCILQRCHVRIEIEGLKDKTDLRPYLGHIDLFVMHRHAVDDEFAFLDGLQAIDTANQGAFSRSCNTGDAGEKPRWNSCGNILQIMQGSIVDIDTSAAEKLPGVKAVVTGKDTSGSKWGVFRYTLDQQFLPTEKVRYFGEEVAAVAAVDEDTALEAMDLIRVTYEELPAVFDPFEAMEDGAPQLHDHPRFKNNINTRVDWHFGDVEAGFAEADVVKEHTFVGNRVYQQPMEPHCAVAQVSADGLLTLWSSTQITPTSA